MFISSYPWMRVDKERRGENLRNKLAYGALFLILPTIDGNNQKKLCWIKGLLP